MANVGTPVLLLVFESLRRAFGWLHMTKRSLCPSREVSFSLKPSPDQDDLFSTLDVMDLFGPHGGQLLSPLRQSVTDDRKSDEKCKMT